MLDQKSKPPAAVIVRVAPPPFVKQDTPPPGSMLASLEAQRSDSKYRKDLPTSRVENPTHHHNVSLQMPPRTGRSASGAPVDSAGFFAGSTAKVMPEVTVSKYGANNAASTKSKRCGCFG